MKEVLANHNLSAMVGSEILNALDNGVLEIAKGKLSTDWKRMKFYREHLRFVEPESYMLGRNAKGQLRSYQYVQLLENLTVLMKHDDVLSAILHPPVNIPEVLCDYRDGDHFKNNKLFQEHGDALQLFFYFDEFEVANPLGYAKTKHKLGGIYYILGNSPPNKRSALHTIQLAMLVSVPDIKEFGFKKFLEPLIDDVHKLEKDGIYIEEMRRHFYGTVAVWLGDNLGSHAIGGFLESFSGSATSRLCRFCNGTRYMMRSCSDMSKFTMRTPDEYDKHVSLVAKYPDMITMYGVKLDSPLNKLQYFHVVSGLPPDIMHDVLEGVLEYELPLIVSKFVMDGHFSLEWLNIQLRTWDYGPLDARNKPVEFPKNLQSKLKLSMNAGRIISMPSCKITINFCESCSPTSL